MSELFRRLEKELGRDVDESGVAFDAVWERLSRRLDEVDELGPLAALKISHDPGDARWESIERELNHRIAEYSEYDEPVAECIRSEQERSELSAAEESRLERALDRFDDREPWEQALSSEQVVSEGRWERIEQGLSRRLNAWDIGVQFERTTIVFPARTLLRAAAVLAIAVLGGVAGTHVWQTRVATVPTWVTQAEGTDMAESALGAARATNISAASGGGVELANRHGFVRLTPGASLELARVSRAGVAYRLRLDSAGPAAGATFYAQRVTGNRRFVVTTDDYDITVTGTYFRVSLDAAGRTVTDVFEGTVRISAGSQGTLDVAAGSRFVWDEAQRAFLVRAGGSVVARADIESRMPDIENIGTFSPLTITAEAARAEVTIDGVYRGVAPLSVLLAPGMRRIVVQASDHALIDTLLIAGSAPVFHAALERLTPVGQRFALGRIVDSVVAATATRTRDEPHAATPAEPARAAGVEQELLDAQQLERTSPAQALTAYLALSRREDASVSVRQAALFGAGRIQAAHGGDHGAARESFMRYLALYPSGIFAREALLRLAELEFEIDQEQSIAYYLRYFDLYPTHYRVPELQYRVGLIHQQYRRFDDAIVMLERALHGARGDQMLRERADAALSKAIAERQTVLDKQTASE